MSKKNIILITSSLTTLVVSILYVGFWSLGYGFTWIMTNFTLVNAYYLFSIFGVFATLIAIAFAYYVPIKIANRQDKIALFEKRYELYLDIEKFTIASMTVTTQLLQRQGMSDKGKLDFLFLKFLTSEHSLADKSQFVIDQLNKIELLFQLNEEDIDHISNLQIILAILQADVMRIELNEQMVSSDELEKEINKLNAFYWNNDSQKAFIQKTLNEKITHLSSIVNEYNLYKKLKAQCKIIY